MKQKDLDNYIAAVQEFCKPENQYARLAQKWSKATEIWALHYDMTHDPAPDGTFEIMFVTPEEAEKALKRGSPYGTVSKISFAAGVALARQPDCCGGTYSLKEATVIATINAEAQRQNELYNLEL